MAKLPTQGRILTETFPPKEREWLPLLLDPLNRFMDEVTRAFNRQLTLKENLAADIKTVVLDGNYPVTFKWDQKSRPTAVIIGQCREVSENHTVVSDALYVDWEYTQEGMLQINAVPNLNPTTSNKFNLTLVIFTG